MHVGVKTLSTFTLIARSYENHSMLIPLLGLKRICCLKILYQMPMEMQTNATHQRRTFNLNEGKD
jgi:hypothetical protein